MRPILITMGDPNGVGPEICNKLMAHLPIELSRHICVVGHGPSLKKAAELLGLNLTWQVEPAQLQGQVRYIDPLPSPEFELKPGCVDALAGAMSIAYVNYAVKEIQAQSAAAMVTAPLCKEAVEPSVPGFQGHTEYIGEMCGDPHPVLALIHGDWVVAHVSTHVSLRQACDMVTLERIQKVGRLLEGLLKRLGKANPKIGVAGLNPHAGENGLFGEEEIHIIRPAVEALQAEGILAEGPYPGDVVFPMLRARRVDGAIAMYHDQGHVVTKTLAFDLGENARLEGVNITLGIDVLRTSVDHGTGFDVAWKGKADAQSLLDALDIAMRMAWDQSPSSYYVKAF